jgi:hypothetical protein
MEWEKEKPLYGEEGQLEYRHSSYKDILPQPRRQPELELRFSSVPPPVTNSQRTTRLLNGMPAPFEPFESIASSGQSTFAQLPSAINLPSFSTFSSLTATQPSFQASRSAAQFLPQSISTPAPYCSTMSGAQASSASTPVSTWLQTVVNLREEFTGPISFIFFAFLF